MGCRVGLSGHWPQRAGKREGGTVPELMLMELVQGSLVGGGGEHGIGLPHSIFVYFSVRAKLPQTTRHTS